MHDSLKKILILLFAFLFPLFGMALEEVKLPFGLLYKISSATMTSPLKCRNFVLHSPKHKLYFVFAAAYNIGKNESSELDHVFIFQDDLDVHSLVFYLVADEKHQRVEQLLNQSFHQDIPDNKFQWYSSVSVSPKAAVSGFFLKKKFFTSSVYLHRGIKLRSVNGETQGISPAFIDAAMPEKLSIPFDLSKISAEAKNLPPEKLSSKQVKKVDDGFLFRTLTLKNKYYYIKETADGIYFAVWVDGKIALNSKFTNNNAVSQLSANGREVQVFSRFKPFKFEIFFKSPDHKHPLYINVRNDDCTREVFTVNSIRTAPVQK